jgi:hypothetical protein
MEAFKLDKEQERVTGAPKSEAVKTALVDKIVDNLQVNP